MIGCESIDSIELLTIMYIIWFGPCVLFTVLMKFCEAAGGEGDYKIFLEKISTCEENSGPLADISNLKVGKLNRTTLGVRGEIILKQDVSDDTTIRLNIKRYSLGRWNLLPINHSPYNVCQFVQKDTFYLASLLENSDLPKKCPFPKGTYHIHNAVITAKKLPSYLPRGCYKGEITLNSKKFKRPSCYYAIVKVAGPSEGTSPSCLH